jgi:hypothetical protein
MTERGNASCGAEVTSSVSVVFPLYSLCSTLMCMQFMWLQMKFASFPRLNGSLGYLEDNN